MPLHIDDVLTPTTAEEIEQAVLDLCATGGLDTTSWQAGSMIRTFIKEQSAAFAMKSLVDIEYIKGGFGDLASGDWAKLWAQEIYNVFFVPAASATGYITGTNAGDTQIDLNPGDLIVANRLTGKTYRNQAIISIPVDDELVGIAISSDELGVLCNAGTGDINIVVSPAQPGFTVINPAPVLGADEETVVALVLRARQKLGSFSPLGPKDAYNYVAKTPLDSFPEKNGTILTPTSTPITRTRTVTSEDTGNVTVYIATAGGAPTPEDVDLVTLGIRRWAEPFCTRSQAAAATEVIVPVTYQVWINSALTVAQIQQVISSALAVYFASIDVGGVVIPPDTGAIYNEALENVIHTALPGIKRVLVSAPATDFTLATNEVAVLGTISGTVTKL